PGTRPIAAAAPHWTSTSLRLGLQGPQHDTELGGTERLLEQRAVWQSVGLRLDLPPPLRRDEHDGGAGMQSPEDSRQVPAGELTVPRRRQVDVDDRDREMPFLDTADCLQVLGRRLDAEPARAQRRREPLAAVPMAFDYENPCLVHLHSRV